MLLSYEAEQIKKTTMAAMWSWSLPIGNGARRQSRLSFYHYYRRSHGVDVETVSANVVWATAGDRSWCGATIAFGDEERI